MTDKSVRTGPLQFGVVQSEWLYYQKWQRARHPRQCLYFDVPTELSLSSIGHSVEVLITRHEILRTTFSADNYGDPLQRVHAPCSLPVHEFTLTTPTLGSPDLDAFCDAPFDIQDEWPLRTAVIHRAEGRRQLLLVVANMAIDLWAQTVLRQELTEILDAAVSGRPVNLPAPDYQPIDQAIADADPARRTLPAYWQDAVATAPSGVFPVEVIPEHVLHLEARLSSPALEHAFRKIHAEHGLPAGPVFLTALAIVLAGFCGQPVVPVSFTWPAREPVRTRQLVASVMRDLVLAVDLSDSPAFLEAAHRVRRSIERAAEQSQFDVLGLLEADSVINRRRGAWRRSAIFINPLLDVVGPQPGSAPSLSATEAHHLVDAGKVVTEVGASKPYDDFNLYASVYIGEEGVPEVLVSTNEAILTEVEAVALTRGVERLLVEFAVTGDLSASKARQLAGLAPRPLGEGWISREGSWFHLGLTKRLLGRHPGVASADVLADPDGELTVRAVTYPGGPSPEDLREFLLAHLDYRHSAVIPERFEVSESLEAKPRTHPREFTEFLENTLREAVASANNLSSVDMSRCYVEAGGRLHRVPRVLAHLRRLGIPDFAAGDFLRPCSLRTLPAFLQSRREAAVREAAVREG